MKLVTKSLTLSTIKEIEFFLEEGEKFVVFVCVLILLFSIFADITLLIAYLLSTVFGTLNKIWGKYGWTNKNRCDNDY